MIKIENVSMYGLEEAIRGMRNPKNSWDRSDSGICGGGDEHIGCDNCSEYDCGHSYDKDFHVGKNDYELMNRLASGGTGTCKIQTNDCSVLGYYGTTVLVEGVRHI